MSQLSVEVDVAQICSGPDETDWFGHVGNSAYAKVWMRALFESTWSERVSKARDLALTEFGVATWPTFVNAGGHFLLGCEPPAILSSPAVVNMKDLQRRITIFFAKFRALLGTR